MVNASPRQPILTSMATKKPKRSKREDAALHRLLRKVERQGRPTTRRRGADRCDVARDIDAKPRIFRSAQPSSQSQRIGSAAHEVTIVGIDRRRSYPDTYFIVTGRWLRSLLKGEGLRSAVATTKNRVQW